MPLLHQVIPIIDVLTAHLENTVADILLHKVIRRAAARGLGVLNKYYSLTDESVMYRIAMSKCLVLCLVIPHTHYISVVLHPRYKLEYFRKQKWEVEWINTARTMVVDQWETYYKPKPMGSNAGSLGRTVR